MPFKRQNHLLGLGRLNRCRVNAVKGKTTKEFGLTGAHSIGLTQ